MNFLVCDVDWLQGAGGSPACPRHLGNIWVRLLSLLPVLLSLRCLKAWSLRFLPLKPTALPLPVWYWA